MAAAPRNPKIRLLIIWCARLALLAYAFQTAAFDHWRADPAHAYGFEGSSLHAVHCHGDRAGCADSSSLGASLSRVSALPQAPAPVAEATVRTPLPIADAFLLTPDEPPRLA